ncbi:uncharacterized protein BYT42DRAFT_619241 [Radiomyces spectabilis]|uniref:uncharacterized protein n=1 Tax=Radiomyces spectabilis TaxID=64574 RepID=UPI0022207515|nr:uncharacterized protein BYT42DRAFT_619241 [Radiomyces spectabilis]KAI8393393.1 hypothetical protein BYT42DRAFT_619241 [Radiomyces spectabilis]
MSAKKNSKKIAPIQEDSKKRSEQHDSDDDFQPLPTFKRRKLVITTKSNTPSDEASCSTKTLRTRDNAADFAPNFEDDHLAYFDPYDDFGPDSSPVAGKGKGKAVAAPAERKNFEPCSSTSIPTILPEDLDLTWLDFSDDFGPDSSFFDGDGKGKAVAVTQQHEHFEQNRNVCSSCGKPGHSRSSNKFCDNYRPRRTLLTPLKRTSIVKTSLKNICRYPILIDTIQEVVKHARDVTYVGSLFANFFVLYCITNEIPLPQFSQKLFYNIFAAVMGQGKNASPTIKSAYIEFKSRVPEYHAVNFESQGYSTIISEIAKDYYTSVQQHILKNYPEKTKHYIFARISDTHDPLFVEGVTVAKRRTIANYIFDQAINDTAAPINFPKNLQPVTASHPSIQNFVNIIKSKPGKKTKEDFVNNPHLYIPHMHEILEKFEQKIFIREETPQNFVSNAYIHRHVKEITKDTHISNKIFAPLNVAVREAIRQRTFLNLPPRVRALPAEILNQLHQFIHETITAIATNNFRPEKYTDPKGTRRFTFLPIYSYQMRHVQFDRQSFSGILTTCKLRNRAIPNETALKNAYFEIFDMKKLGFRTIESLATDRRLFWNCMRTDGTDAEFLFRKPKKPALPQWTPKALQRNLKNATIWGVDPGMTDIFVASDGSSYTPHRVRKISCKEYYHLCGFNFATYKRAKYFEDTPHIKTIMANIPSERTSSIADFVKSVRCRLEHHSELCDFFDNRYRISNIFHISLEHSIPNQNP